MAEEERARQSELVQAVEVEAVEKAPDGGGQEASSSGLAYEEAASEL